MIENTDTQQIITRFPPSPTGFFHIGGARTALFNYLFARKNNGKLLFRLEDTDVERSKPEYADNLIDGLQWLGIVFDNKKPIKQSERGEIYQNYLKKMVEAGHAYVSKEEPIKDDLKQRAEVIRFKNPNKKVSFDDLIRGTIEFDTTDLGDFVIAKSMREPLYHLAVVVDDFEMGVTHIIRGEDGISNTPRQILIQEAIRAPRPIYAHLPLVLATDKSKLSKRKHGETVSLEYYKQRGYLPEAIINFLALLGWNPGTEQEIFSVDELIKEFDLTRVHKGGAVFNIQKLDWINKEYLKKIPPDKLEKEILKWLTAALEKENISNENTQISKLVPIILDRIVTFGDITNMVERGELNYFFKEPLYEPRSLLCKADQSTIKTTLHLQTVIDIIRTISEKNFTKEKVKIAVWDYAEKNGRGNVLWPMRFALSGKEKSPDPFTLAEILGQDKTIERLQNAYNLLIKLV